ncbi:MAG: squalene/phytoene synthase family protein [Candidatus Berkiella sp.]
MNTQPHFPLPAGASLYYALLYAAQSSRDAMCLVNAFIQEMKSIAVSVNEKSVAIAKLNWWSTEISQTFKGYPHHPLSILLSSVIEHFGLAENEFQLIIQSCLIDLEYQYSTEQQKEIYFRSNYGAMLNLLSCTTARTLAPKTFITHLSAMLQTIWEIKHAGVDSHRTQSYFGQSDPLKLTNVLKIHSEFAKAQFNQAMLSIKAQDRYPQLSLIILANLNHKLLDEIIRSNFNVLTQRISLTPIKKLWITWRTNAQEKKIKLIK